MDVTKSSFRICFFGASVTQQSTGYAALLKKELNENVKIFGFGGMHLKDAGVCYIDDVLEWRPSICFVDWFSTGYKECSKKTEELLDTIIYKFTKASCNLIFLFFPYKNHERKEFYQFCRKFLQKRKMAFIDVDEQVRGDRETILRDSIHTNDYGSRVYAGIIKEFYKKIKDQLVLPTEIYDTKYTKIKSIDVEQEFTKQLLLEGDCEIIGICSLVGPYSGILEVSDENHNYKKNTWDRWCYYIREAFVLEHILKGRMKIEITNDKFDTSICKENIDFSKFEKKLTVRKIYFIGNYLHVINMDEGNRIFCFLDDFISTLRDKDIIIYGAGKCAKKFLTKVQEKILPIGIAVTTMNNNPKEILGIPVHAIDYYVSHSKHALIIVMVENWYQQNEIKHILTAMNFKYRIIENIGRIIDSN